MTVQKGQAPDHPTKAFAFALISVVLGVIGTLTVLEIALRFLPVSSGPKSQPVTAEKPVFHFQPNQTVTFSRGWDFQMLNFRNVNNAGWVNDIDYRNDDSRPLFAVVGDSYIEAAMVPYGETLYGRLADALGPKLKVYSFGASGAPLSQYLIWAQHAVRAYGAEALLINVVGNDFDESHVAYSIGPGWWLYTPDADGALRLRLAEYRPGWLRPLAYGSALLRYVFFNLQVAARWQELKYLVFGRPALAAPRYAGNTATDLAPARVAASLAVIDAFFRDLPNLVGLPPDRILFTVDGFRYPDAAAHVDTYFGAMRQAFIAKGRSLNYTVVDLDPWFFADFAKRRARFEYPHDGHWNGLGHEVAAQAALASDFMTKLRNMR